MAGAHGVRAWREFPLGTTSRSRRTRGRIGSHPRIRNSCISLKLTPTSWGRKRRSPGSIPPRTVWKPQPHWLVANWLGFMEPAGGESCPSGQGRGRAAHGEVKVPSPDQNPSTSMSTIPTNRGPKRSSHGSIPPHMVWKLQLRVRHCRLGLVMPADHTQWV